VSRRSFSLAIWKAHHETPPEELSWSFSRTAPSELQKSFRGVSQTAPRELPESFHRVVGELSGSFSQRAPAELPASFSQRATREFPESSREASSAPLLVFKLE